MDTSGCVNEYGQETLRKIRDLKQGRFGETRIECSFGQTPYALELMVSECSADLSLMGMLGDWRKKNEMWYLSQFPVSAERTASWFKNGVIGVPDRLLFLVTVGGRHIGHVGLYRFDFEGRICDVDNILRGEEGHRGVMGDAIRNLMGWGMRTLGIRGYGLKVRSDNELAIRFYKRLGFIETGRIPLITKQGKDGPQLAEAPGSDPSSADGFYLVMRLSNSPR